MASAHPYDLYGSRYQVLCGQSPTAKKTRITSMAMHLQRPPVGLTALSQADEELAILSV